MEPSPITFARGAPSLDIIPVDDLRTAAQAAFASDPKGAFSYGTAGGYGPLRDWIAERHSVDREQVIATNGSMQADAFLFQLMVEPGDTVVVEAPTYDRTLLVLRELGAEILAIPVEGDGLDVDALATALEGGARLARGSGFASDGIGSPLLPTALGFIAQCRCYEQPPFS